MKSVTVTIDQLDGAIARLNEVFSPTHPGWRYFVEPITGTDQYILYLDGVRSTSRICTSDAVTIHRIASAMKATQWAMADEAVAA